MNDQCVLIPGVDGQPMDPEVWENFLAAYRKEVPPKLKVWERKLALSQPNPFWFSGQTF